MLACHPRQSHQGAHHEYATPNACMQVGKRLANKVLMPNLEYSLQKSRTVIYCEPKLDVAVM